MTDTFAHPRRPREQINAPPGRFREGVGTTAFVLRDLRGVPTGRAGLSALCFPLSLPRCLLTWGARDQYGRQKASRAAKRRAASTYSGLPGGGARLHVPGSQAVIQGWTTFPSSGLIPSLPRTSGRFCGFRFSKGFQARAAGEPRVSTQGWGEILSLLRGIIKRPLRCCRF